MDLAIKHLLDDKDGMDTYDFLVNHIDNPDIDLPALTDNLLRVDTTGQFLASSARFLNSVDPKRFHSEVGRLTDGAINRDRERRYIGSLLEALWGPDYRDRAVALSQNDDNFRRIYKRIFPTGNSL